MIVKGNLVKPNATIIEDINYILDKNGIISPAIKINPPLKVKMFNNTEMEQSFIHLNPHIEPDYNLIYKGTLVNVTKDKETGIRYILEYLDDTDTIDFNTPLFPDICPSCGSVLRPYNGQLMCTNISCPTQILERCIHFIKSIRINLHGIYYRIFCNLILKGHIKNLINIFNINDETIIKENKNISEKHVKIYKLLINEVVGHVSMVDFLHGMCIIPDVDDNLDIIKEFVRHQNDILAKENKVFNIQILLTAIKNVVKDCNLQVTYRFDKDSNLLSIFDQIQKLTLNQLDNLKNVFGDIDFYSIAKIIDYVLDNEYMFKEFRDINIDGCEY